MPRGSWASDEMQQYMSDRKKAFTDSQVEGRSRAWLNAACETFNARFPVPPPTAEEVAEEGSLEAAKAAKLERRNGVSTPHRACIQIPD